jgi:hypothetical protein
MSMGMCIKCLLFRGKNHFEIIEIYELLLTN